MEFINGFKVTDDMLMKKHNYTVADVMTSIMKVFSHQLFVTGFVHADPHPGNILVRPNPNKTNDFQIVLLDHGLYSECRDSFRVDYCKLWKSMILMDSKKLKEVCYNWGIYDEELFASLQLMKPYKPDDKMKQKQNVIKRKVNRQDIMSFRKNI